MEATSHPARAVVAFSAPVKISQSRSNRGLLNPSRESIRRGNRTGKAKHAGTPVLVGDRLSVATTLAKSGGLTVTAFANACMRNKHIGDVQPSAQCAPRTMGVSPPCVRDTDVVA